MFFMCLCGFSPGTHAVETHAVTRVGLVGDSKLPIFVNVSAHSYPSVLALWHTVDILRVSPAFHSTVAGITSGPP